MYVKEHIILIKEICFVKVRDFSRESFHISTLEDWNSSGDILLLLLKII